MSAARWKAFVSSALLLAAGCATAGKGRRTTRLAAEYYPLAVGNRWSYEVTMLGETAVRDVVITSQSDGFYVDSQGGQLTADAYGVRDQKRYLLRDPVEAEQSWSNIVSVSSIERYKVKDAGQPCQVPAGDFPDCAVVESRNKVDTRTTLINEVTFAAGVGIVRIEVFAEHEGRRVPQTSIRLQKFQVTSARTP